MLFDDPGANPPTHGVDEMARNFDRVIGYVKTWWRPLMYATLFVLATAISLVLNADATSASSYLRAVGIWVFSVMLLAIFVDLFTVPTKDADAEGGPANPSPDGCKQIRHWMVFSYTFMLFALGISILPFLTSDEGKQTVRPIMTFKGCVIGKSVAEEVNCLSGDRQWLVSICSKVVEVKADTTLAAEPSLAATPRVLEEDTALAGEAGESTADAANQTDLVVDQADAIRSYQASGGLVVPLYVIVVSLMGAAISLTRRIPEIQRHGSPNFTPTDEEPALTPLGVRERLVFQIVQFISAPLLAIVAYQLIGSSSVQTSVLLAFVAGFSSESVLVMIRAMFDKIRPNLAAEPVKGSISGLVWDSVANKPLAGARISVVGLSDAETVTDERGFFALNGVLTGERVVEASADGSQGMAKVTTNGCKTTACHIVCTPRA